MAATRSGSRRRAGFVEPLLPTLVDAPPAGEGWEHEIKYDGYRTQLVLDGGDARAFTRNGFDWSSRYGPLLKHALTLPCRSARIDGEVIVQDKEGRSDFAALSSAIYARPGDLILYAFDLLDLDGIDLRREPLSDRRAKLQDLVGRDPGRRIQYSDSVAGGGAELLNAACGMGLEGIVSKRLNSIYRSGRQLSWLKSKCYEESDLILVGVESAPGAPAYAFLAREGASGLEYAGSAFVTLAGEERAAFWDWVEAAARPSPPLPMQRKGKRVWVEPELVVRVQHLRGTGKLRHATLRGLLPPSKLN